ncbi:MAG: hypothetical protein DLM73_14370 [Chthoniobacterales bacterium]|nr:MAG: hypothetical protein DLM73_14370 [Chthoniobacterales bacterium]
MTKKTTVRPLSAEQRAAWRKHNLETLAQSAALSFGEKLALLEDLEEVTTALGYRRDPGTGRLRKAEWPSADL